jgi:hypothetical protein
VTAASLDGANEGALTRPAVVLLSRDLLTERSLLDWNSSDDEADRRIRAEMAELWSGPSKRSRRAPPLEFSTAAGKLALRLWRGQLFHRMNRAKYENWWSLLPSETTAAIDVGIEPYETWAKFLADYWRKERPGVPLIDVCPERTLWDLLLHELPRLGFEDFARLLEAPVRDRTAYAEDFGKRVTRTLKESLGVPSHRPRLRPTEADRADDLWLRRLGAYVLNFPEKVR